MKFYNHQRPRRFWAAIARLGVLAGKVHDSGSSLLRICRGGPRPMEFRFQKVDPSLY